MKTMSLILEDESGKEQFEFKMDGEPVPKSADKVGECVYEIENMCQAIDNLFEKIQANLELIADYHLDDNAKEFALKIKEQFVKVQEDYYDKVHDYAGEEGGDWMKLSLLDACYKFIGKDARQRLLLPNIRDNYRIVADEGYSEDELQTYIDSIREQFDLSEDFK